MKFKTMALLAGSFVTAFPGFAAESDSIVNSRIDSNLLEFNVEARLDAQLVDTDGHTDDAKTGFVGKYIAVNAHGTIIDGLTYTWRQRFSRTPHDDNFWDQTDILGLDYKMDKFDFGAGKQVVMIGGYEYNREPIDLMCPNLFVANVACYQFGVSAGYQINPDHHIGFQISQSLFATPADRNLYAYNLMWRGGRELTDRLRLETLWSINEIEYQKGKYCNYIALGNKLLIDDNITVLADLMTRTYPDNKAFKNNTFMAECSWNFRPGWKATGKVSYDCNLGVNRTAASEVARGSEITIVGAVAEWNPLRTARHRLRLHAGCFYSFGKNKNKEDLMQKNTFYASLGLTWHMDLFRIKR